jgi:hypothetical protein
MDIWYQDLILEKLRHESFLQNYGSKIKELCFNFNLLDFQMFDLINGIQDSMVGTEEHQTIAACLDHILQHYINFQLLN